MSKVVQIPDGWVKGSLSSFTECFSGGTPSRSKSEFYEGTIPWVKSGEVNNRFIYDTEEKISESEIRESSAKLVNPNSILVAMYGATAGKVAVLKVLAATNQAVLAMNPVDSNLCSDFLFWVMEYEAVRLMKKVQGAAQPNLSKNLIGNHKVTLPQLPEQKAIADLLSTWDEAIEKTERLIQAKVRQKLGELHSRISSQKANSTIGSFAKPVVRKVDKPEESYVAMGIRSHFKGTFQRLVEDPRTVNMDSLYRVKENDLILNITFAWEGAIALVKKEDEECYVSHRFPTYEIKRSKAEPCFIRQLIMSSRMKYDLSNISPGGAGRNRVLNKKDFLKMPIWLPDLETQKNIGEYLGAIDNEIDLLKQLADKYKTQKRGLMQKMLTGEWRVKPEIVNQYMEA